MGTDSAHEAGTATAPLPPYVGPFQSAIHCVSVDVVDPHPPMYTRFQTPPHDVRSAVAGTIDDVSRIAGFSP